jgi:hypothetical protein
MGIPEAQLDTWAKQGSVAQSRETYATIKNVLEQKSAGYANKNFSCFLQGSYGNDTNVYADSDVDVVIRLESIFYPDISSMPYADQVAYRAAASAAAYVYSDFKKEVVSHLKENFGAQVHVGNKAVLIQGNGNRRDADVLPAAAYRKYLRFRSWNDQDYIEGICFWSQDGMQIINYPRLHSDHCTNKHQATNGWFKPAVRVLKNLRNRMIDGGVIENGLAPSYFIEGMLYNAPDANFGNSLQDTLVNTLTWLSNTDRSKLVCAHEQYPLLSETSVVAWRAEKCARFLDAVANFWNQW